jgi:hypothetical protein
MDEQDIIEENYQLHAENAELRAKLKMSPRQGTPAAAEKSYTPPTSNADLTTKQADFDKAVAEKVAELGIAREGTNAGTPTPGKEPNLTERARAAAASKG